MQAQVLKYLIFTLSILSFSACSKTQKPAQQPASAGYYAYAADDLKDAQRKAQKTQVHCNGTCENQSVGMLAVATNNTVNTCTAFLIAPQKIITNAHCIPDSLRFDRKPFSERIWIIFPNAEKIEAIRVLESQYPPKKIGSDYAILELKTPSIQMPIPIQSNGLKGNNWRVTKIDPIPGTKAEGVMNTTNCNMINYSIINYTSANPFNTVQTIADCEILAGNSGSPLLNENNEAAGIIQSTVKQNLIPESFLKLMDAAVKPIAIATNLSCIQSFNKDNKCSLFIMDNEKLEEIIMNEAKMERIKNGANIEVQNWLNENLNWEISQYRKQKKIITTAIPKCISQNEQNDFLIPNFSVEIQLNSYLQVMGFPKNEPALKASIHDGQFFLENEPLDIQKCSS